MQTQRPPTRAKHTGSSNHGRTRRKYKFHQTQCLAVLLLILLVYVFGLHQGLRVARDMEADASHKIRRSFLGFLDSDDAGDDERSSADDDGRNAEKSAKDDLRDGNDLLNSRRDVAKSKATNPLESRVNHYQSRIQKQREKNQKKGKEGGAKPVDVMHSAPETLRLPKPIINVGFPKAGTSTIFSFFHCNGLSSQHWFCCDDTKQNHPAWSSKRKLMSRCMLENLIHGTRVFEGCGNFDVYTEINGPRYFRQTEGMNMLDDGTILSVNRSLGSNFRLFFPQHHQIDRIHHDYPNATLVLNHRPVDSWVASVMKWNKNLKFEILNEFFFQNQTRFLFGDNFTETDNVSPFFHALDNIPGLLKMVYEYHIAYIREWVAKHPSHTLVEVDITHIETGRILADAFGLHEDCWGHFNMNKPNDENAKETAIVNSMNKISERNNALGADRLKRMKWKHDKKKLEFYQRKREETKRKEWSFWYEISTLLF